MTGIVPGRVSFVITNFNYGRFVGAAVDSARTQTHPDVEVVVVDDGSTDGSVALLTDLAATTGITVLARANGGQAAATNAGIAASTGEVVCLLDADDLAGPARAERALAALRAHPGTGWCFHLLAPVDESLAPLGEPSVAPTEVFDWRPHVARGRLGRLVPFAVPATSGLCLHRSVVDRLFPLPTAPGILINDNYVKYAAMALVPGVFLGEVLGVQRLHGANQLTHRGEHGPHLAAVDATTALELRRRGLTSPRFTDNLLALALAVHGRPVTGPAAAAAATYRRDLGPRRRLRISAKRWSYELRWRIRRAPQPSSLPPGVAR